MALSENFANEVNRVKTRMDHEEDARIAYGIKKCGWLIDPSCSWCGDTGYERNLGTGDITGPCFCTAGREMTKAY